MTNLDKLPKAELLPDRTAERLKDEADATDIFNLVRMIRKEDEGASITECHYYSEGRCREFIKIFMKDRHPTPSAAPDGLRLVPIDGNTQYTEMLRIFKRKMEADGTGYRELERLTGIDHATLQRFLKKQRPTNPENFLKLCAWSGYRLTAAPSLAAQGGE